MTKQLLAVELILIPPDSPPTLNLPVILTLLTLQLFITDCERISPVRPPTELFPIPVIIPFLIEQFSIVALTAVPINPPTRL